MPYTTPQESSGQMPSSEARQTQPVWRKASFSASGDCVEVAERDSMIMMRDSNSPRSHMLRYTAEEWQAFLHGVKAGEFDDLAPQGGMKFTVRPTDSVRDDSAPQNGLDLADRVLFRATSTWRKCLMHLVLLAVIFVGLGTVAHAAVGVSPWIAAAGSIGGGAAAGGAAYARRRAVKQVRDSEKKAT